MKVTLFLFIFAVLVIFTGCTRQETQTAIHFDSYRDIPGITDEQIQAINEIRQRYGYFIYGMMQNDEAFLTASGEIAGFAGGVSNWLTELFDIPFIPVIYDTLPDLMQALEDGAVHFTGQLPEVVALYADFITTRPISSRSLAVARMPHSLPFEVIEQHHPIRLVFSTGTVIADVLEMFGMFTFFETIHTDTREEAAALLAGGEADAYIGDGVITLSIDFPGFSVEPFYPFIFGYATFAARNPEFTPFIDAVQKIMDNGGMSILARLYAEGKEDIDRHRMSLLLTPEEQAFIAGNPVIPMAAHSFSYPISFYNDWDNEIQGIALDILRQVEIITGLRFEIIEPVRMFTGAVREQLYRGEAYIATGTFRPNVADYDIFILTNAFFSDNFAFLSRTDMPIVSINEVLYMRIGVVDGGYYEAIFYEMFPDHLQTVRFNFQDDMLDALVAYDIDLAFTGYRGLLRATHLMERTDLRANLIFDKSYYISFAVSENMPLLASIINKSLTIIDTDSITEDWMGRTFDFNLRMLRARLPWLVGTIALLVVIFILSLILIYLQRRKDVIKKMSQIAIAEESSRAKSRFLARMSHEIRTPMNAIIGMATIGKDAQDPERKNDCFGKIEQASGYLLDIINQILDMAKIESNKFELNLKPLNFKTMLNKVVSLLSIPMAAKSIAFNYQADDDLPDYIISDEVRLTQVIVNLLTNATKFTAESGMVTLRVKKFTTEHNILHIEVADTGIGIPAHLQDRVFEAFEQADTDSNNLNVGVGLGLAISKQIIELMNGDIRLISAENKGTTFIIEIPYKEAEGDDEPIENDVLLTTKYEGRTVLLVEDIEMNREIMVALLESMDITVECAADGAQAVKMFNLYPTRYNIIFMDLQMPTLNGLEATRRIRALDIPMAKEIPIIAMTAHIYQADIDACFEAGMNGHIGKPINLKQLMDYLQRWLSCD